MSEDVRPFEEYKEMIKDMRKEEMIRGLYDLSARVTKQENIIKEVREGIIKYKEILETGVENNAFYIYLDSPIQKLESFLEILDKENK